MPIRVQSAARPNREILSEHSSDDCYSEYEPTDATEDSAAFIAAAASRMQSEARAAFLAARELINDGPRASLHGAWIERIADLLDVTHAAIATSPRGAQPSHRLHQRAH